MHSLQTSAADCCFVTVCCKEATHYLLFFEVLQDSVHVELSCIYHLFYIWCRCRALSIILKTPVSIIFYVAGMFLPQVNLILTRYHYFFTRLQISNHARGRRGGGGGGEIRVRLYLQHVSFVKSAKDK